MRHEPVFTIAEMLEKVKFVDDNSTPMFAKNLFFINKKTKVLYLIVAAHNTTFDTKGLEKHLKCGSGNLRGGDPELMEQILGVGKGSVNLFSLLNDTGKKISLLMDQKLMNDCQLIGFHPM